MIVSTISRPVDPVTLAQATTRGVAILVADAAIAMFDSGRWSQEWPLAREIRSLAVLIGRMHLEIGYIAERSFAERRVEAMASAAHEIMVEARRACAAGQAVISPTTDIVLLDLHAEAVLISGYSLLAI